MSGPVVLVTDEGPLRRVVLNRPDARNALDAGLVDALRAALDDAAASDARAVVLRGAGSCFSAGADLKELRAMRSATLESNEAESRRLAGLFEDIARHPLPVVAAVHGPAIAGGAGLAVACDLTIATEGARFAFPEVRIGFVPAIVLNFLLRCAGEKAVRDLCLTGRSLDAAEALRLGLVTRVVPDDGLDAAVAELGATLALASPEAVATTKALMPELRGLPLPEGLARAARRNAEARQAADCREGIAAFLEKRKPRWQTPTDTSPGGSA